MQRVLHFSDVHVDVPLAAMPFSELLVPKRMLGAANLVLRRKAWFRDSRDKLAALARFAEHEAIDLTICTGDYTALGTAPELSAARAAIDPLTSRPEGYVTVPGNHDLYVNDSVRDGRFERIFGDLLRSDAPECAVDGPWPIVRFVGHALAVIALNSARPNPQLWRSSGRIPDAQLRALSGLLGEPRIRERVVLVITHYAPRRADGSPDKKQHGLDNADALLEVCARVPRCAILHGHIHHRYHVMASNGVALFGAGSATQEGREAFWLYELEGSQLRAFPGHWSGEAYAVDRSAVQTCF
jgi:3',5'-cyclic AMP phosphodiesterase CpdA